MPQGGNGKPVKYQDVSDPHAGVFESGYPRVLKLHQSQGVVYYYYYYYPYASAPYGTT